MSVNWCQQASGWMKNGECPRECIVINWVNIDILFSKLHPVFDNNELRHLFFTYLHKQVNSIPGQWMRHTCMY